MMPDQPRPESDAANIACTDRTAAVVFRAEIAA